MSTEPALICLSAKHSALLAGFFGSLVALTFTKELTRVQMLMALLTGLLTSAYLTPLVMFYFKITPEINDGMAFIVGLVAMHDVPAIIAIAEIVRKNPLELLKRILPK